MSKPIRKLLRFLISENSLYLFSALCLLLGCFQVMSGQAPGAASLKTDLPLLATFKFYEVLVVLSCCVVFRRLAIENDGLLLACIALVLFLDPTAFNTRFYSVDKSMGLAVNAVCFGLVLVNISLLRWVGRLPISRSACMGIASVAALIYFGPALLDADFSNVSFTSTLSQDHRYYFLWWGLLVAAAVGRRWIESEPRAGELSRHRIYYRYLDAVLVIFPFIILLTHLFLMEGVFSVKIYPACFAPVILGLMLLVERVVPRALDRHAGLALVGMWSAVLLSGSHSPEAQLQVAGVLVTPARFVAFLNALAGAVLYCRSGSAPFLAHSLLSGAACVAGATVPAMIDGVITLQPEPLAVIWLFSVLAALRFGRPLDVGIAGFTSILQLVRVLDLTPHVAVFSAIQLTGLWLIALGRMYDIKQLVNLTAELAGCLMLYTYVALKADRFHHDPIQAYFIFQIVGFFAMGWVFRQKSLCGLSACLGGLDLGLASFQRMQTVDFSGLARDLGGVGLLFLAFLLLFVGLVFSFRKEQLLAWLGDDRN
ncbi:MAG: hypothetical protein HY815_08695, partial [Candidatus Riflebacteria bacterium]|nr:hypothetical protein [Candidatus Riflebacteria bacterium]